MALRLGIDIAAVLLQVGSGHEPQGPSSQPGTSLCQMHAVDIPAKTTAGKNKNSTLPPQTLFHSSALLRHIPNPLGVLNAVVFWGGGKVLEGTTGGLGFPLHSLNGCQKSGNPKMGCKPWQPWYMETWQLKPAFQFLKKNGTNTQMCATGILRMKSNATRGGLQCMLATAGCCTSLWSVIDSVRAHVQSTWICFEFHSLGPVRTLVSSSVGSVSLKRTPLYHPVRLFSLDNHTPANNISCESLDTGRNRRGRAQTTRTT